MSTAAPPPKPSTSFNGVALLQQLPKLPVVEGTDPARFPMDAFRLAVTDQVSKLLNVEPEKVFEAVQLHAKDVDLVVALPRFRLPGKPQEIAAKLASEVSRAAVAINLRVR